MDEGLERLEVEREDGTRASLLLMSPPRDAQAPVVLCMPAMGVEARYYLPLLRALREAGVHAAVTDLRGKGECSVRPGRGVDFGYREMVSVDYPAAVRRLREALPGRRLYLLGHSLGGQMGALFVSAYPDALDGLILVASCSNHFAGWPQPWRWPVLLGTQAASVVAGVVGYFPGRRLRFAGTESRGVIQDWARQARTGRYEPAGVGVDFEGALRAVRLPVLAISLEADFYAPSAAVDRLCAKMPQARLRRWHWRPPPHEAKAVNHFRWVKRPQPVVSRIEQWLREEALPASS